jgi:ribosome-associated heat shock protein Hsp15
MSEALRIDKWLWAARFFKTRGLAQQAIEQGRVRVGDERVKPARALRVGDRLRIEQSGDHEREVIVLELSDRRGPAVQAQTLYRETDESVRARETRLEARRLAPEPSQTIEGGRPTKRQRRDLDRWRGLP